MTKVTDTQSNILDHIAEANGEHNCECQKYSIEIWTGEVPEGADPGEYVEYIETGCHQTTTRTFAPGHDAKLKSLMIAAGAQGNAVRRDEGGMANTGDAVTMAGAFGFESQVGAGIARAQARQAERAAKKAAKAAAKADKPAKTPKAPRKAAALVEPVTIKVGRWQYSAIINPADNSAEYTSGSGEAKTVDAGKYQIVTA